MEFYADKIAQLLNVLNSNNNAKQDFGPSNEYIKAKEGLILIAEFLSLSMCCSKIVEKIWILFEEGHQTAVVEYLIIK